MNKHIFFDNISTTQLAPEVISSMNISINKFYGTTTSIHGFSRKMQVEIESCRRKISELLNILPENLFFTSSGTEANNIAILGTIRKNKIKTVITSKLEHESVLQTLFYLEKQNIIKIYFVELAQTFNIKLDSLELLLTQNKNSFVSFSHTDFFVGNYIAINKISKLCEKYNAIFHSDMALSIGYLKNDLQMLNIDIATASAHKFHGPKGIGFIYIKPKINISPIIFGENQEFGLKSGTENIYGIVGMTKALIIAEKNMEKDRNKIIMLKNYFISRIFSQKELFKSIEFISNTEKNNIGRIINIKFHSISSSEKMLMKLDNKKIACSTGNNKYLKTDKSIKFSFSKYNTKAEINYCIAVLCEIFNK